RAFHVTGVQTCALPIYVLGREAGTQGHAHAVTSVDKRVGSRSIDAACTTSGQYSCHGANVNRLTGFNADSHHPGDGTVLVLDQVNRIPLVQEGGAAFQVSLIEGVQQS